MSYGKRAVHWAAIGLIAGAGLCLAPLAGAGSREELSKDSRDSLERLYRNSPEASSLGRSARAILVFPKVMRTGLIARPYSHFAGAFGEGELIKGGAAAGYYRLVSSKWRNEPNAFSVAVFVTSEAGEASLASGRWSNGPDPSVKVVDGSVTTNAAGQTGDAVAYIFNDQGQVISGSLSGANVTAIDDRR